MKSLNRKRTMYLTEDEIRDNAKVILGFDEKDPDVKQGTGQITTFNQLGFKGVSDKPDGWYLPNDKQDIAIILETKSEKEDVFSEKHYAELVKNIEITAQQYKRVVGILYNGTEVRVVKYIKGSEQYEEIADVAKTLQNKRYYIALFKENRINKQLIYSLTKKINDCLHIQFGIKNLYHRMIITACALVAKRYGAMLEKGMEYSLMTSSILNTLSKSLEKDRKQNLKLDLLVEVYSEIKMNMTNNQEAIDNFITWVSEISDCVNSDYWNGEDVMGIFFNEFNRYKKKSESGQVFTPDHITSFMYRLIDVNQHDRVLDATCGSGAFLVKAMCNMVKEAGGVNTSEAMAIKSSQLFGIEFDRENRREVATVIRRWFKGKLEYQYVEYGDAQDIDKVKGLLKDTIYLVKRVGNTSTLIISSPTSNFIFDTGNIVIKTKSRNVYVVDRETFDNWKDNEDEDS